MLDTTLLQGLALLETQDGKKSIKGPDGTDSHNLFNVKDFSGQGFRAHDKAEGSRDAYRVYGSREESIQDLIGLLERKYPDAHAALQSGDAAAFANGLKKGGYATDPNYVTKLTGAIARARGTSGGAKVAVQQSVLQGENAIGQLAELRKAGWADDIDEALKNGWKPEEIVKRIAGADVEEAQAAKQRRDEQGAVSRFTEAAGNRLSDAGLAVKQIFSSGDEEQALRDEAAQRATNIDRRALDATTAGKLGGAAPDVGLAIAAGLAAPFTGGGSIAPLVALEGAAGAVSGATRPTTQEGERTKNVLGEALLGAGTAGLIGTGGKVVGKALTRDGVQVAEREALAARLRSEGLPVNAATLTDGGKNLASRLGTSSEVTAMREGADRTIATKIADELGVPNYGGAIDTELLNTARPAIKQTLDQATAFDLTLPQSLKGDLQAIVNSANNPLTSGVAEANVVKQAAANVVKAADAGAPVSARQLQELMSELKAITRNQTSSVTERQAAGEMVGKLNDTLVGAMSPEQAAAFKEANRRYASLKAVEKMVSLSNDTGAVSPRQVLQSVKTGQFKNAFLKDEAPFQSLGRTAAEALGPANGRGLGDLLGRAVGTGDNVLGAAAVLEPMTGGGAYLGKKLAEKLLAKAVTSENPAVVRLLTGVGGKKANPTLQKYLAKALRSTGSAAAIAQ